MPMLLLQLQLRKLKLIASADAHAAVGCCSSGGFYDSPRSRLAISSSTARSSLDRLSSPDDEIL